MNKLLLASVCIALVSPAVSAAAPPAPEPAAGAAAAPSARQTELARRFVQAYFSADTYMDFVRAGYRQAATDEMGAFDDADGAEAFTAQMEQILTLIEPKVRERLPKLTNAYAEAYAREFSAEELEQMVRFAESPAGRHYLASALTLETHPLVQEAQMELWLELAPVIEEDAKKLCAEKAAQRVAMGDTNAKCPLSGETETASG